MVLLTAWIPSGRRSAQHIRGTPRTLVGSTAEGGSEQGRAQEEGPRPEGRTLRSLLFGAGTLVSCVRPGFPFFRLLQISVSWSFSQILFSRICSDGRSAGRSGRAGSPSGRELPTFTVAGKPWKHVILQTEAVGLVSWAGLKATDESRSGRPISQKTRTVHWARRPQNGADIGWGREGGKKDTRQIGLLFFFTLNISIKFVTVHIQRPSTSEIGSGTPCTRVSQE